MQLCCSGSISDNSIKVCAYHAKASQEYFVWISLDFYLNVFSWTMKNIILICFILLLRKVPMHYGISLRYFSNTLRHCKKKKMLNFKRKDLKFMNGISFFWDSALITNLLRIHKIVENRMVVRKSTFCLWCIDTQ